MNVDVESHPVGYFTPQTFEKSKAKRKQNYFTCPRKFLKNDRKINIKVICSIFC